MADINIGQFSEALNDKADRDLQNTQPLMSDYVIDYKNPTSDNSYWYRIYKSGFMELGGRAYRGAGDQVNIRIMQYTNYTISLTCLNTNYIAWVTDKQTGYFKFDTTNNNGYVDYVVRGLKKIV